MNRRDFVGRCGLIAVAGFTAEMTLSQRAEAFEAVMVGNMPRHIKTPVICHPDEARTTTPPHDKPWDPQTKLVAGMDDPRLPKMPTKPTLLDFYRYRMPNCAHLLQSANFAMKNGMEEKVAMACLLHDLSVEAFIRTDHGFWTATLVAPYVDEEITWAIQKHQALRFFADDSVGYAYPAAYRKWFGDNYEVEPWVQAEYEEAKDHKWYMTSRLITLNDLYSFNPEENEITIDQFEDLVGRNWKQPKEGLGFDGSSVAHMWRTIIWPHSFL